MDDLTIPRIHVCGYYDNHAEKPVPGEQVTPRVMISYEIEYFEKPCDPFFVDGIQVPIHRNTVMVTKPGSFRIDPHPFATIYLKLFAQGGIARLLDTFPPAFTVRDPERFRQLLHAIICLNEEPEQADSLRQGIALLTLIEELRTDAFLLQPRSKMQAAKEFIETHYPETISTTRIADSVFISESRFRYLFRSTFGVTAHDYLLQVRIKAAKELLLTGSNTLSDIALRCGFGTAKNFSAVFSREVGMPPSRYRQELYRRYLADQLPHIPEHQQ